MFQETTVARLLRYQPGAEDAHGNPVDKWADLPGLDLPLIGWVAANSDEPKLAGHDRVVVDVVATANGTIPHVPHNQDKVVLDDGHEYDVVGYPEDYRGNAITDDAGFVINLRRVEG